MRYSIRYTEKKFKSFLKIILWKTYPREIFNVLLKVFPLSSVFLHWNIFYRFLNFFLVSMANFSASTFYPFPMNISFSLRISLCLFSLLCTVFTSSQSDCLFSTFLLFFFFFLTFHYSTATSNRRENIAWLLCRSKILHNIAPYLSQIPSFSNDFSPMCETCSI